MSSPKVDVKALAKLARLEVPEAELERLEKEIPDILSFVATVQQAAAEAPKESSALRNIIRTDESPHEGGLHTEKLLNAAPTRKENRVMVKQVISRKKKS